MSLKTNTVSSGYSTGVINSNFKKIEEYVNDNLLNRDGVTPGEPNQMEVDLDMNSQDILNVGRIDAKEISLDGIPIKETLDNVVEEATQEANRAQQEANRAEQEADRAERVVEDLSGPYEFVGDYAPALTLTKYSQVVRDSQGEFWRVSGQVDLPYTTTGDGLPENDAFVPVGDAVLRQELANPDLGAALVAYPDGTVEDGLYARSLYTDGLASLSSVDTTHLADGQIALSGGGVWSYRSSDFTDALMNDPTSQLFLPASGVGAWVKDVGTLTNTVTLTVGATGQFSTINSAIDYASKFKPATNSSASAENSHVRILLLSGFVMQEQVVCRGVDLGYILVESEDDEVVVDGNYITRQFPEAPNRFPVWFAFENSVMPIIGALFVLSDAGAKNNIYGIRTLQSRALILAGCGFKGASGINGRCAEFARSSVVSAPGSVWGGGGEVGVRVSNNSLCDLRDATIIDSGFNLDVGGGCCVNAQNANLTGATSRGISVTGPALVQAINSDVSNSGSEGIRATAAGCFIHFEAGKANNCTLGISASSGAIINAKGAEARFCNSGVLCTEGATVTAPDIDVSNCSLIGLNMQNGGRIIAPNCNADDCGINAIRMEHSEAVVTNGSGKRAGSDGIRCYPGGQLHAAGFDCSASMGVGAEGGIDARQGAWVNFQGGNARKGATDVATDIKVSSGAIVNASSATGGTNIAPLTLTSSGIIFK